jgi:hypothetical protein
MKTIHVNGKTYKFGRKHPISAGPHFKLRNYRLASAPLPPNHVSYASKAMASLNNMFGNDQESDCTIACMAHAIGVFTGNAGDIFIPTLDQVNAMYSVCEGAPGFPASDNGCDEITVLNYSKSHGLAGHKIEAWLALDPDNMEECKTAIDLFENMIYAIDLPDAYVNPFPSQSGFTWNVAGAPDAENGHCFLSTGYDFRVTGHKGFEIVPWGGLIGRMTPAATSAYCAASSDGGLYTALSKEILIAAQQKSPNGLDWSQLLADFDSMS